MKVGGGGTDIKFLPRVAKHIKLRTRLDMIPYIQSPRADNKTV